LHNYKYEKEFILSGGIGLEQLPAIKNIIQSGLPVHAIDVNSRFEAEPGLKDIEKLKEFYHELQR
jgi:phosphoribosylanthranilate isomerase